MKPGWYYHPNCYLKILVLKTFAVDPEGFYRVKAYYGTTYKELLPSKVSKIHKDHCLIREGE